MRWLTMLLLSSAMAAPAMAQPAPPPMDAPPHHRPHARPRPHRSPSHAGMHSRDQRGTPDDQGPFTPEANRAYQGGGVVLQGAPGGPPPQPQPMPR